MKRFIATFTYGTPPFALSEVLGIDALNKPDAKKQARAYASKHFSCWDNCEVAVEELTPAKLQAIEARLEELEAQYRVFANIRNTLWKCHGAAKGWLMAE